MEQGYKGVYILDILLLYSQTINSNKQYNKHAKVTQPYLAAIQPTYNKQTATHNNTATSIITYRNNTQ
jgi:hypothetical protein